MDNKKIFVFLMMGIFVISMASAELTTWDNWKVYDDTTRTVTVRDLTGEIGSIRLDSAIKENVGMTDYGKVAGFRLCAYEDYNDIIKNLDIYNKNFEDWKSHKTDKSIDLLYVDSYSDKIVDDYSIDPSTCVWNDVYGYDMCESYISGTHTERKPNYKKITPAVLKKNECVDVSIFTEVKEGDYYEWIFDFYGVRIDEFASWEQSDNVDLFAGYLMDEGVSGTGTIIDVNGINNGTSTGVTNVSGLFGDGAYYFGNNENDVITLTTMSGLGGTIQDGIAVSFCTQTNSTKALSDWITPFVVLGGTDNLNFMMGRNQADDLHVYIDTASGGILQGHHLNAGYNDGAWHNIIYSVDASNNNITFYVDGVLLATTYDTQASPVFAEFTVNAQIGKDTGTNDYFGIINNMYIWNRTITDAEAIKQWNSGACLEWTDSFGADPVITLNSPASANYTTAQTPTINITASDDVELSDVKLYVNAVLNQTNASGINNSDYLFDLALGDGDYSIYGKATDNESRTTNSATIRIVIDSIDPYVTSTNITDLTTFSLPVNSTWDLDASDTHLDSCYFNTTENATFTVVTCNATINTTWTTDANQSIQLCANDTFGNENCTTEDLYVYFLDIDQAVDKNPAGEGQDVTWNLTVGLTDTTTTTANFWFNGTMYEPNTTTATQNQTYFEITINIPDGWGNSTGITYDWLWNYTIDTIQNSTNTTTSTITVFDLALDDCSSYSDIIMNMSLKDEELATPVNESAGAKVEVDVYVTSIDDPTLQLHYFNTFTNENNPQVCMPSGLLNNSQYYIDFTIGFESTDRVWEFYYLDDGILNSSKVFNARTTSNINLFDLKTTDSTSFLFNYFDKDGLAVVDAIVHVYRKYIGDGQFLNVERSKQDENGDTIVHLVEEDVIYYFLITQYGEILYTSSDYTALCQSTPCTIQIEASGGSATFPTDWDLVDGGAFSISSDSSTRNVTLTYSFNESDTINLTVYKYNSDGSYSEIGTSSATGSSGTIGVTAPQVAGNVTFFASVTKGGDFKKSEWIDFTQKSSYFFGVVMSLFLSALIILSLGLFAIYEGAGTIGYVILGVIISGALGLIRTELSTGVNIVIYLVLAGGILLWKLTRGRS